MSNILALHEANEGVQSWSGFNGIRKMNRPNDWNSRLASFIALAENHAGHAAAIWQGKLYEAMSTGDFPALFSDTLDRELLARYRAIAPVMRPIFKQSRLMNFRSVKRFIQGTGAESLQEVPESGMYKQRDKTASSVEYAPKKYGVLTSFTWEALINDDLNFFDTTAQDMAESAMNTEERLLTNVFFNGAGVIDAAFAQATNSALPLTRLNLEIAIQEMMGSIAAYRSDKDEPILNVPKFLVVPPALQLTAEEILSDAALISGNTTANTSQNFLARRGIQLVINPWMPVIITTGTLGATTWALFSDTIDVAEQGKLMGHETPEIFLRSSGAMNLSGGDAGAFAGSFDEDQIDYKVRYVQGQVALDPRGGWASDGQ